MPENIQPVAVDAAAVPINAVAGDFDCYATNGLGAELRQGEVLTGLEQLVRISAEGEAQIQQHPYSIILSQDCDLAADFRERAANRPSVMNGVLLFEAFPSDQFLDGLPFNSREKKQVRQNQNARYHYLWPAPAERDLTNAGFSAVVIDFRRYFTIPACEIEAQVQHGARRRARLCSPFVEHLQSRALHFLGRIALPDIE